MRVDRNIANILLFKIDILLSIKSVEFGSESTRAEVDNKVELEKKFGLLCLLVS